jgi:hypothetical protein
LESEIKKYLRQTNGRITWRKLASLLAGYFESWEVTGSLEATEQNPKYSLLKFWKDKQLPDLQAVTQRVELETGKRVVIRYQWDDATPHKDGKL